MRDRWNSNHRDTTGLFDTIRRVDRAVRYARGANVRDRTKRSRAASRSAVTRPDRL